MGIKRKPWSRRPDDEGEHRETEPAWHAFQTYRDLGPGRTMAKAVSELGRKPSYKSSMEKWSRWHQWVARCEEWDAHLDAVTQKAAETVAIRQGRLARDMIEFFQGWLAELRASEEPDITASEMIKLLALALKTDQLANDRPTDLTESRVQVYTPRRPIGDDDE